MLINFTVWQNWLQSHLRIYYGNKNTLYIWINLSQHQASCATKIWLQKQKPLPTSKTLRIHNIKLTEKWLKQHHGLFTGTHHWQVIIISDLSDKPQQSILTTILNKATTCQVVSCSAHSSDDELITARTSCHVVYYYIWLADVSLLEMANLEALIQKCHWW